ncbi:MAG TPA: N-acetylmuramoyl-L-alanine amidase [Candidatus Cottocaccamicrobium excrementipullorum]|nr:N-acetylmuramoyl-L-alanine amidase [Candidatus Cottocaccamicrobium excrementipullorum]
MNIEKQYLTISNYNRPGTKRARTTAVACHYIGNPGTSAQANRNYFENLKDTHTTKASCHYIIGLDGEILQLIPEDEISWCTNQANSYTISIEACHPDSTGQFTDATYKSYVALCADICQRWGLDPQNGGLIRHYDVTKKVCPKWFVDHPEAWTQFKRDVQAAMAVAQQEPGWQHTDIGWWYMYDDGTYPANKWELINHHWYLFNKDGYMVTGWHRWDGQTCDPADGSGDWYFLDNTAGGPYEGACWHTRENGAQEIWYVE